MKSSWAWMVVLVALGSSLIRAQPQIDVRKLSGTWYPLAAAWTSLLTNPVAEYKIQSNDKNSFDLILPRYRNKKCKEVRYSYIAKEGGRFRSKVGRFEVHFLDTDYENYLIATVGFGSNPILYLDGRKKDLTEEMKAKFQSQVSKMGYKEKYATYRPQTCKSN